MGRRRTYEPTEENRRAIATWYARLEDRVRDRNGWPSSRPVTQLEMEAAELILNVDERGNLVLDEAGRPRPINQSRLGRIQKADQPGVSAPGEPSVQALLAACKREGLVSRATTLEQFIGKLVPPPAGRLVEDEDSPAHEGLLRRLTPFAGTVAAVSVPPAAQDALERARQEPWWHHEAERWILRELEDRATHRRTFGEWFNGLRNHCDGVRNVLREVGAIQDSVGAIRAAKKPEE